MKVPRLRIKGDGLYVGRAGVSLVVVVLIIICALVVGATDIWWKGVLVLASIPLFLIYSHCVLLIHKGEVLRQCPHCQGRGWICEPRQDGGNHE